MIMEVTLILIYAPRALAQCSVLNEVSLGRSCVLTMHESYYHLPSDLRPPLDPSNLIAIFDTPAIIKKGPGGLIGERDAALAEARDRLRAAADEAKEPLTWNHTMVFLF